MDNKNIALGLMTGIIIFLAFLLFRPMVFGPVSGPGEISGSWPVGSGMRSGMGFGEGPGMMQGYNYSSGPRMMGSGNMMGYGDMMALYYSDAKPISSERALMSMKELAEQYGPIWRIS